MKIINRVLCAFVVAGWIGSFGSAQAAETDEITKGNKEKIEFSWGAAAGGSIDLSGNDMSSVDFSAVFGFKRSWIQFLGVGAEIDIMVSNSARSFPIFASFKTNFRQRPSLVFLDVRAGVSLNYLPNDIQQTGAYTFAGVGVNLASSRTFSSHLVLGYTFKDYRNLTSLAGETIPIHDLHMASVKLGITF